jgi:integrase
MKARVEHRVPLSGRALEILREVRGNATERDDDDYVFIGQREGTPLSNMALLMMLRRMKRDDITTHGFRSTFSDWASEVSSFSGEVRETALAHTIQNKAERAYRRGDALERRRKMMEDWAKWCTSKLELVSDSIA